jgi:hypothetical protein
MIRQFGVPQKWGDWRQTLNLFVMPALLNHYKDVRLLATEIISELYKKKGKELQSEVVASA